MSIQPLFNPYQLTEDISLSSHIVFAPLTRIRAASFTDPSDLNLEHYKIRAEYNPKTLLISEAVTLSKKASGAYIPHLYTDNQIKGWKKITESVQKAGAYFAIQVTAAGRVAAPSLVKASGIKLVGPTEDGFPTEEARQAAEKEGVKLHGLTKEEIKEFAEDYKQAAKNVIETIGADILDLHACNTALIHQFLDEEANKRTDEYGGSVENRSRFLFEMLNAVLSVAPQKKVGVRFSPWYEAPGFSSRTDDQVKLYDYISKRLQKDYPNLAYVSIIEPRITSDRDNSNSNTEASNDLFFENWKGTIITAGNYLAIPREELAKEIEKKGDRTLFAFGRPTTSNPDLIYKLKNDLPLTPYDRPTFYSINNWGYNSFGTHDKAGISEEVAKAQNAKPLF